MSNIYIVNDKDEVIGIKKRGTLSPQDMYRISALWLSNSKGEVLIAQRAFTKSHGPGKWGPAVAGTVEDGETYEQNIIKEAWEELGIKDVELTLGPKEFNRSQSAYFCQWFFATLDWQQEDFVLQKDEVEQVRWIDPKELIGLIRANPTDFTYSMSNPERQRLLGLDRL